MAASPVLIHHLKLSICTVLLLCLTGTAFAQLRSTYYLLSCPLALPIIRAEVLKAVLLEPRMGASLLRLHFHDCFVQGCDASVLLDDTENFRGEKTAFPNNNSLRGFDVMDDIKHKLENLCPGVVSCADILAVAARDSVYALGGPFWEVRLGRRDSTKASWSDANKDLPAPFLNLTGLITAFANKGFTRQEMVALSGSHTIGMARCRTFRNRIYNDTNIESSFRESKQAVCPAVGGDDNLSALDGSHSDGNCFDNSYYKNLVKKKGLLHSDQALFNGGPTDAQVRAYVHDSSLFFRDFAKAMIKMSELTPLTAPHGQVRTNCRKVN
ncbi:cationic peroxidase 1-like [Prosopis cineraria]|uniref:cationic peroxidase 1-like n=1 Tax=Prosopis cineraria TaxID=364024 RepID=UPI00240FFC26|nr:cationic peroxidase 1-like [Prosopis cineraria]